MNVPCAAKVRRSAWWAPAAVLAIGLLCCLAAGAAAQEDVAAAAALPATVASAGNKVSAASCGSSATIHLCLLVQGASCGKGGIMLPQLDNDVRELAARLGITTRKAHLTVGVQPLFSTRVSGALQG
jgi:hypothetical protein